MEELDYIGGVIVDGEQLTLYSMATLVGALLVYFDVYDQSDVIIVGNRTELISESQPSLQRS